RFYILMEKIAALCSDRILSQNKEDVRTAIAEGICKPAQIEPLGNGIDITHFDRQRLDDHTLAKRRRALGIPVDSPVVGFVGRLVAEKGILELLAAARSIIQQVPTVRFLMIGPSDQEKEDALTPQIAQDANLADALVFTGHCPQPLMPEHYGLMDMLVLPSHREGFPRSLMEGSAMGIPCVATDIRGCREAVQHDRNGILVPLNDVPALAEAIVELLTHPEKARQMGRAGRQMAIEHFDEQQIFKRVLQTYQTLLLQKGLLVPQSNTLIREGLS
ncbi:MAG: glycosyltransferase, partial [Ardenticatenales bacterium]|nr:glycosyltransferase [Ardenticatenales bacterium]